MSQLPGQLGDQQCRYYSPNLGWNSLADELLRGFPPESPNESQPVCGGHGEHLVGKTRSAAFQTCRQHQPHQWFTLQEWRSTFLYDNHAGVVMSEHGKGLQMPECSMNLSNGNQASADAHEVIGKINQDIFDGLSTHPVVAAPRLKLAVVGDDFGNRTPLSFIDYNQFERFGYDVIKALDESNLLCQSGICQVLVIGSSVKGWAAKDGTIVPWKPTSDLDVAIVCPDLVSSMGHLLELGDRCKNVFKNTGPLGFYNVTRVGRLLRKVANEWSTVIKALISFKLTVDSETRFHNPFSLYNQEEPLWNVNDLQGFYRHVEQKWGNDYLVSDYATFLVPSLPSPSPLCPYFPFLPRMTVVAFSFLPLMTTWDNRVLSFNSVGVSWVFPSHVT